MWAEFPLHLEELRLLQLSQPDFSIIPRWARLIGRFCHSAVFRLKQCRRVSISMPAMLGNQLSPSSLKIVSDHFLRLRELTIFANIFSGMMDGNYHLYYNSLVQRGVNICVKYASDYYYNFAHPDMALLKRTLLTRQAANIFARAAMKVYLLLQQEHQLPEMVEAVVTLAKGFGQTAGLSFVTNQIVTSKQDRHRVLTSLKQVRGFGICRGVDEEVKEGEVETIDQILTMLASDKMRGNLCRVALPKALLLKSDKWVNHLGGEAEIEKARAATMFCTWGDGSSATVQVDYLNPSSGKLVLSL